LQLYDAIQHLGCNNNKLVNNKKIYMPSLKKKSQECSRLKQTCTISRTRKACTSFHFANVVVAVDSSHKTTSSSALWTSCHLSSQFVNRQV